MKIINENIITKYIDNEVLNNSKSFDEARKNKDDELILSLIIKTEKLLDGRNDLNRMQIYYDIANGYSDLRYINNSDLYLEKEILNYRKAIDIYNNPFRTNIDDTYSDIFDYIAMRCYTNIGLLFSRVGRYIKAIENYIDALNIDNGFAMASLNLSISLFEYATLQNSSFDRDYYNKAGYYYYQLTMKNKINLEESYYLDQVTNYILKFDRIYVEKVLKDEDTLIESSLIMSAREKKYKRIISLHNLYLNNISEFSFAPYNTEDNLMIKCDKKHILMFNQLKSDYVNCRYMWYDSVWKDDSKNSYFMDKYNLYQNDNDGLYFYKYFKLKCSFKMIYSLFGNISYFINSYFELGIKDEDVNFKNIWREEIKDRNGNLYAVKNPLLRRNNILINAIYWIQKDVNEDDKIVTNPYSKKIFCLRNNIEHRSVVFSNTCQKIDGIDFMNPIELDIMTNDLLKYAREVLIYLFLIINSVDN